MHTTKAAAAAADSSLQCIKRALWCAPYPTIPGESYILAKACIAPNNSRLWRWGRGIAGAAMSSFPHRCPCSWRRRKCNPYFRCRKKSLVSCGACKRLTSSPSAISTYGPVRIIRKDVSLNEIFSCNAPALSLIS